MLGRAALLTQLCRNGRRAPANTRVPSRGKALDNWHRPTMAEYGEPKMPWGPESAKRDALTPISAWVENVTMQLTSN